MHQITVPGSNETYVLGINDRAAAGGDLLGFYYDAQWMPHHFAKFGSSYVTVEIPGLYYFEAQALNNDRLLIGYGLITTAEPSGFAYLGASKEHTTKALTTLQHPNAEYTIATGVNDADAVVGTYYGYHPVWHEGAFLWQGGTSTDLPAVEGHTVYPSDVNNVGQVVGTVYNYNTGVTHGFLYDDGAYQFFSHPQSDWISVSGVNDHDHIVGSYFLFEWADIYDTCCWRGYLLQGGTFTTINVTNDAQTSVAGINNAGNMAGTFYRPGDGWLAHGFRAVPKPPPKLKTPAKVAAR